MITLRTAQNELMIKQYFCALYFLDMEVNAMFKTKINCPRQARLLSKAAFYNLLGVSARFVLFCVFQSAAFRTGKKKPNRRLSFSNRLMYVELFR